MSGPAFELAAAATLADALGLASRGDFPAALEAVERAIEAAPEAAEGYLAKGRIIRAWLARADAAEAAQGKGCDHGVMLRAFRRATECGAPPLRRVETLKEYALALEPIGRHKEAAAAFEDALALLPVDAPAKLRGELADLASLAHERSGDVARALERHRQAESNYHDERGDLPAFYAREAELLERLGRMSELFQCYARLVEAAPDKVLFAQAEETRPKAAARERLRRLLVAINEHLLANPGDWVARIVKAGFFYRLGRYRQAESLILRAVETAHDHFYTYHLLGKIRLKSGRAGAALEALEKARPLAPDYLDLDRDWAAALEACDRKHDALGVYKRIETKWPGRREILVRAARLREELGLLEEAYETHRQAAALSTGVAAREALEKLAALAMRLGRPAAAEAHLDGALAVAGGGPMARALRLERAAARAASGALEGALEDVAAVEGERAEPGDGLYREALARKVALLVKLERGEEAVRVADALVALAGGDPDERALLLRGDALRAAKRFQESVQCYRLAADKKLAETLLDAGTKLFERADYTKALGTLNESFRRNPQSWEVFYFAGAAYARLGEAAPAAKYLAVAAKANKGALALMEKDRDFDPVRASPEVQAVLSGQTGASS